MIQVEDEKMIFLDANAFYSYYGRSKLGMTSEPVDEERLKKYLEQQREKSLPTSVYIEIMTHFRNNPKVLQYLLEFRYAKGLPLFNNIPDYVVSEDEITSVKSFLCITKKLLFKWLNRRSQKHSCTWETFNNGLLKTFPLLEPSIKVRLFYR